MASQNESLILKALIEMNAKLNSVYALMVELSKKNGINTNETEYNYDNSLDNFLHNPYLDKLIDDNLNNKEK